MSVSGHKARKITASILEPPVDPKKIANEHGIEVVERSLKSCLGALISDGDGAVIVLSDTIVEIGRVNFTIAHELGHFFCHLGLRRGFECSEDDIFRPSKGKQHESEANQFAAELLMPEKFFIKRLDSDGPSYDLIPELASTFQTSLTATAFRYAKLTEEQCAVVISQGGQIIWSRRSKYYEHFVPDGMLPSESKAYDCSKGGNARSCEQIEPSIWVDESDLDNLRLWEVSYPLRKYDKVLTVLWASSFDEEAPLSEYDDEVLDGELKFKRR